MKLELLKCSYNLPDRRLWLGVVFQNGFREGFGKASRAATLLCTAGDIRDPPGKPPDVEGSGDGESSTCHCLRARVSSGSTGQSVHPLGCKIQNARMRSTCRSKGDVLCGKLGSLAAHHAQGLWHLRQCCSGSYNLSCARVMCDRQSSGSRLVRGVGRIGLVSVSL